MDIPRFGATFGLASALYHFTICYFKRLKKKYSRAEVSERMAIFIAAMIGSLPLSFGLQKNEINLVKLLFYPLLARCVCDKLLEIGLIPKIERGGDVLAYMLACFPIPYTFVLEIHNSRDMSRIV